MKTRRGRSCRINKGKIQSIRIRGGKGVIAMKCMSSSSGRQKGMTSGMEKPQVGVLWQSHDNL